MEQTQDFKEAISDVVRVIRKYHLNYGQLKYIFSQARKDIENMDIDLLDNRFLRWTECPWSLP